MIRPLSLHSHLHHKKLPGYSLLEVGIVLLIIGVMAAGIVKGTTLLDSAKLNTVISQYNELRTATYTFIDRYGHLPGNFNRASTQIDGSLKNGLGDGSLHGQGLDQNSEAFNFWQHLAAAKLLDGHAFSMGVPSSRIEGVWTVEYQPVHNAEGVWFMLGKPHGTRSTGALLTPQQAQSIIHKLDDGNPSTGLIRAIDGTNKQAGSCLHQQSFNLSTKEQACVLLFKI